MNAAAHTDERAMRRTESAELPVDTSEKPIAADGRTRSPVRSASSSRSSQLSVGVIVDLFRSPSAGGHVKTWEKLGRAACGEPLDLTVYFLGNERSVVPLAENVRFVHLPPMWSTSSLPFLRGIPANTDLAPVHFGALRRFRRHDVLHATDAYFSMARAARMVSRWSRCTLVHSTHTDTPGYTRVYTEQVLRRIAGDGALGRLLRQRWNMPERMGRRMERQLARYLRSCRWAWAPDENERKQLHSAIALERTSLLRRGIDAESFSPMRRDRVRLEQTYGIAPGSAVLLFAGRIDQGKDVMTLARAARLLLDRGVPVHVICAGEGSQSGDLRALLGAQVSLPGQVAQDDLAWLYASADLFVFCSQIEVFPNVVLEAKAAGLPVMVSAQGGSAKLVGTADGVAVGSNDPQDWAREIEMLVRGPDRLRAMAIAARHSAENDWPSWRQVLREDLLPVWRAVARERGLLS